MPTPVCFDAQLGKGTQCNERKRLEGEPSEKMSRKILTREQSGNGRDE